MRVPRDLEGLVDGAGGSGRPAPAPWRPPDASSRSGAGPAGRVLEFRRRSGLPVRRRRRTLGLLRQFALAVVLVGTPAAALWWSATSPRFALARIDVETTERVNREWVETRLGRLHGRNLVWMSMKSVERTLADHPWIRGVEVSKSLPDRLRVAVVERQPVAVFAGPEGRVYVDREGRLIAPVDGGEAPPAAEAGDGVRPAGYLVIREAPAAAPDAARSGGEREQGLRRALDAAQALSRVDPSWGAGLTEVEVLGEEDLLLRTRELPFPLLVEAGTVEARARRFQQAMPEMLARVPRPEWVDLRFSNRMVLRPADGTPVARFGDGRGEPHGAT